MNRAVWSAVLCTAFQRRGAPGHRAPIQSGAERRTPYGDGSWEAASSFLNGSGLMTR